MTFTELTTAALDALRWPLTKVGDSEVTFGKILVLLGLIAVGYALAMITERGLQGLSHPGRRTSLSTPAAYALSRITRYAIWIATAMAALDYLGINMSHFALVGGAIGVGIGFGLQNIFSNFISGLVLLLERTLKIGDFVDLQSGVTGTVAEIGIRYTRVTTNDAVDVIVPNSEFINGRVTNWTFNNRLRRIHVPFGVAYGSDKDRVAEAGKAAAAHVPGTITDDTHHVEVWLVGFGDSSLNFELVVWCGPELTMRPGRTQALYLWALETQLHARNIEIPFPQRDLNIRTGTLQVALHNTPDENKP